MKEICHLQMHTCATTTATNKIEYTPLIEDLRKKNIRNLKIFFSNKLNKKSKDLFQKFKDMARALKTLGKNDKHAMQFLREDNKFT